MSETAGLRLAAGRRWFSLGGSTWSGCLPTRACTRSSPECHGPVDPNIAGVTWGTKPCRDPCCTATLRFNIQPRLGGRVLRAFGSPCSPETPPSDPSFPARVRSPPPAPIPPSAAGREALSDTASRRSLAPCHQHRHAPPGVPRSLARPPHAVVVRSNAAAATAGAGAARPPARPVVEVSTAPSSSSSSSASAASAPATTSTATTTAPCRRPASRDPRPP